MATLNDVMYAWYLTATGHTAEDNLSIQDLMYEWFMITLGYTPADNKTLNDLQYEYYSTVEPTPIGG